MRGPCIVYGCKIRRNRSSTRRTRNLAVHDVVDMAKKGHFQIACSKYFDAVHNSDLGLGVNHPNQFFEESQKLVNGDIKIEPKKERSTVKKEVVNDIEDMEFDEF